MRRFAPAYWPRPKPVPHFKVEPEWRRIHRIADGLEPDLRRAFLRTVRTLQANLDVDRLHTLLRAGEQGQLGAFWAAYEAELAPTIREPLRDAYLQAAQRTQQGFAGIRFDLTNPDAVRFIETQAAQLVRGVTQETQAAIRAVIRRGFVEGLDVDTMARRIREAVGLTERYVVAVENYRRGQLAAGVTPSKIEDRAQRYAQRLTTLRARTIARTETIRAANAGQQAVWGTARREGLLPADVRQEWIITPDDRLCETCEAIPDQNADGVPMGGLFNTNLGPVSGPPAHPGCRCALGLLTLEVA